MFGGKQLADRPRKWLKFFVAALASVSAAYAISYIANLGASEIDATSGFLATLTAVGAACSLQDMLVALPFAFLICLEPPLGRERFASVFLLALVFDLAIFLSAAMGSTHHLSSLYTGYAHLALSLFSFAVLLVYLSYVFRFVFRKLPPLAAKLFSVPQAGKSKIFLISFFILLVAWSPYVIFMAPGSDCVDMGHQVAQFTTGSYSTHHPLYSTFLYGAVFSLGDGLAGVNAGLLIVVLLQTLALAAVLSLEIVELSRMGFGRRVLVVALLFFATVPLFGSYCQWVVKDSLFGASFALYVTVYARCCICARKTGVRTRDLVLLLAISVVVGLLRNNGFYVVAFTALAFAIAYRRRLSARKLVLPLLAIPLIIGFNQVAMVVTHAQQGDIREALSIPFQQTARYAVEHPDDVTQLEKEAIDAVLDYSDLADRYEWRTSDPVKEKAKTDDKGALLEYFKVWFAQGLRHPGCYAESLLDQTFGYWSLEDPSIYEQDFAKFSNHWVGRRVGEESIQFFPGLANGVKQIAGMLRSMPFFGLFSISGFYTLAVAVLAGLVLYRKKPHALIVLVPSTVLFLTYMAGPLNGSIRYSFGYIAAFPVVVGAIFYMLFSTPPKKPR